jgi:hypothetical protein
MFKAGKITIRIAGKERSIDAMVNEQQGIAFHPIPNDTVFYLRCRGGFMYTRLKTGGAIPVYPAPGDAETASLFATTIAMITTDGLQGLSWDERNELAQYWKNNGAGSWVIVLPEEAVI